MSAPRGAVAAGHPDTVAAAAEILRAGGNAIDAALAAVLASTVSEGPLTGLGGGGHALVRTADGAVRAVDFFVRTPGLGRHLDEPTRARGFRAVRIDFGERDQVFHIGGGSVAVPGMMAGVEHLHRRFGSLPLTELVAPACRLARGGSALTASMAAIVEILEEITCGSAAGRAMFRPGGAAIAAGARVAVPAAADYLEDFAARGAAPSYTGDVAHRILAAIEADGGYLTAADLAAYQVEEAPAEVVDFAALRLAMPPPPSLGGALIAFALRLLADDAHILEAMSGPALLRICAAMSSADALRNERIDPHLIIGYRGGDHRDPEVVDRYRARFASLLRHPERLNQPVRTSPLGSTTHVSVVAEDGSACSVTTSNGEGSAVWVDELGIHLNNMMGEEDLHPGAFHQYPAGVTLPSMMSPTLATSASGRIMALGSGGSNRLRSAILQVVLHHLSRQLPLAEAVAHPRVHWEHGHVDLEPGFDDAAVADLEARGLQLVRWTRSNFYFGGVHTAARGGGAGYAAVGDARRGGAAAIVEA